MIFAGNLRLYRWQNLLIGMQDLMFISLYIAEFGLMLLVRPQRKPNVPMTGVSFSQFQWTYGGITPVFDGSGSAKSGEHLPHSSSVHDSVIITPVTDIPVSSHASDAPRSQQAEA
uniref:Uncharacterized protein n=1 Tax=Nelumbo nucifera TaxID=4432 RepID=A0A822YP23_NELNU|nr:TPA_asm: hypothetical protein HUJ06_012172 [Nelumbo nucifera]